MGMSASSASTWRQPQPANAHAHRGRQMAQRQPFNAMDGSYRTSVSTTRSDRSDSTAEVENLLAQTSRHTHGRNANIDTANTQWGASMSRVPTAQATPARAPTAQSTARGIVSTPYAFRLSDSPHLPWMQRLVRLRTSVGARSSNRQECPWDDAALPHIRSIGWAMQFYGFSYALKVQLKRGRYRYINT